MYHFESIAVTDRGCVREHNEDAVLALVERGVFCVADGMGGAARGQVASQQVVDCIAKAFRHNDSLSAMDLLAAIKAAILTANSRIRDEVRRNELSSMGSTVAALYLDAAGGQCWAIHAGDSRIYRFREQAITRLTVDHSMAAAMEMESEEQAPALIRGRLTRAVGMQETLELDVTQWHLRPDDLYLLCSDGLTNHLRDNEIQDILVRRERSSLKTIAKSLIDEAKRRGGRDNVSVVLAKVRDRESPSGPLRRRTIMIGGGIVCVVLAVVLAWGIQIAWHRRGASAAQSATANRTESPAYELATPSLPAEQAEPRHDRAATPNASNTAVAPAEKPASEFSVRWRQIQQTCVEIEQNRYRQGDSCRELLLAATVDADVAQRSRQLLKAFDTGFERCLRAAIDHAAVTGQWQEVANLLDGNQRLPETLRAGDLWRYARSWCSIYTDLTANTAAENRAITEIRALVTNYCRTSGAGRQSSFETPAVCILTDASPAEFCRLANGFLTAIRAELPAKADRLMANIEVVPLDDLDAVMGALWPTMKRSDRGANVKKIRAIQRELLSFRKRVEELNPAANADHGLTIIADGIKRLPELQEQIKNHVRRLALGIQAVPKDPAHPAARRFRNQLFADRYVADFDTNQGLFSDDQARELRRLFEATYVRE